MKKINFILLILITFAIGHLISLDNQSVELKDLQIPSSPAFILLDIAPTSIERPTSVKALGTSVLNNINQNNGMPQNFAFEVTPYWFIKHKNMTARKFWGINTNGSSEIFSALNQFNLSFAFVQKDLTDSLKLKNPSNIALGVRTTLIRYISRQTRKDIIEVSDNLTKINKIVGEKLKSYAIQLREKRIELDKLYFDTTGLKSAKEIEIDDFE